MPRFLLAGAALIALAGPAAGAARRHAIDPRDAEIAALRAEVEALRQRLDADEATQRTTTLAASHNRLYTVEGSGTKATQ